MAVAGHPVGVTVVHPGYVKTAIARNAGHVEGIDKEAGIKVFNRVAITSAHRAARSILKGVRKNRARVVVGLDGRVFDLLVRIFPAGYQRILGPMTARFQSSSR
jgi:short-subunit dehydrogenase